MSGINNADSKDAPAPDGASAALVRAAQQPMAEASTSQDAHPAPKPPKPPKKPPSGPERAIGRTLAVGTRAAAVVMLAGLVFVLSAGVGRSDFTEFQPTDPGLRSLAGVVNGVAKGEPRAVLLAGVLLLVLTPASRCVVALVHYAKKRDRVFTAIALFVLSALLLGVFGVLSF